MYKSKEIRWFKNAPDHSIIDWFNKQGQTFENTGSRTDFYLPTDKEDITIKLREGNIEIKQRKGEPLRGRLTTSAEGLFENWTKWSFNADKADKLSKEIISHNPYQWIETKKTRIGVKVTGDSNGKLQILPIKTFVGSGCQIEYTLLVIKGKTVYTFALEWFGETDVQLPKELIIEILGDTKLNLEGSFGYGGFLKKTFGQSVEVTPTGKIKRS